MRILYAVPSARFFLSHRLPLALAAKNAGYDVHVATADGDGVDRIAAAGLQWHCVRGGPLRQKPWSDLLTLIDLVRLYRKLRPAIVHHVTFKQILYGTIAARLTRVPAVVNAMTGMGDTFAAHSVSDRLWTALIVALFRIFVRHRRMRVIVQNPDDLALMRRLRLARENQLALVRGSGVDPEHFAPPPPATNDVPVIVLLGRVVYPKGIAEFAGASRLLRDAGVRARFVVAGELDRESGAALPDQRFEEWQREGAIEYIGFRDDPRDVYAMADIVCLPSYREGLPKTLLEAASCGLPIVTTDVPGCREAVADGENGILVPARSVEPLAAALRTLIENPDLRRTMGKRGRQRVIENYSLNAVITATLSIYDELSAAAPAPVSTRESGA
jgi:glycosyltransferase involved in cell wall biosynthesis